MTTIIHKNPKAEQVDVGSLDPGSGFINETGQLSLLLGDRMAGMRIAFCLESNQFWNLLDSEIVTPIDLHITAHPKGTLK